MNITVYTALFGDLDALWSIPPNVYHPDVRFVAFTDRPRRQVGLWDRGRMIPGTGDRTGIPLWEVHQVEPKWGNRRTARHYKTSPHRYLPEADVWVWLDANVRLRITPDEAVARWLKASNLATFAHPDRGCLYDEALFCSEKRKDKAATLAAQAAHYAAEGMPRRWGLAETRCVIRRNTAKMNALGDAWWSEIEQYSLRDQVSFPYVCWKAGLRWNVIPGRAWVKGGNDAFWFVKHRGRV